jgi:hypothetical protein
MVPKLDFDKLPVKVTDNIHKYTAEEQQLIYKYLSQLDESQQQTYNIAKDHLGTSFNIMKSNGFEKWNSSQ